MTESDPPPPDPRTAALAAGPFAAVDRYLDALFAPPGPALDAALAAARDAGLPGDDAAARGADAFNRALAAEARVEAVAVQQIGAKGHDGLALAIVRAPGEGG